jgi:hypothetical protein
MKTITVNCYINLISYHQIIKLIFYERNENIVLAEDNSSYHCCLRLEKKDINYMLLQMEESN